MKYKVGDRVRIKSLDWYNKNKDNYGAIYAGNGFCFWKNMTRHCGEIMKITTVKVDPEDSNKGFYFMENSEEKWTDGMIEGLVKELLDNDMEEHQKIVDEIMAIQGIEPVEAEMEEDDIFDDTVPLPDSFVERMTHKIVDSELFKAEPLDIPTMTTDFVKERGLPCPNGYIFKDENGNVINATKIVLEKKKKSYPKTYEECCEILDIIDNRPPWHGYRSVQLKIFQKLLICRDAYWKIAGEEMRLGKPWKPDWLDDDTKKCVITSTGVFETFGGLGYINYILTFPTREMRDAFKENFDPDIEICKEFL